MLSNINLALSRKTSNFAGIITLAKSAVRTRTHPSYLEPVVPIGRTNGQRLHLCTFFVRQMSTSSGLSRPQPNSSADPLSSREGRGEGVPVKSYQEIPGPWKMPLVQLSPELFKADPFKSVQLVSELQGKYGSIYKAKLSPFMPEFVVIFDPNDLSTVFRSDGKYPKRFPMDVWLELRKKLGIPYGLFLSEGQDWHDQRRPISKFMMMPRKVAEYHEQFNEVTSDLVRQIRKGRDESGLIIDASDYLYKWSFESVSVFVLGKRLGSLDEEIPPNCQEFINATHSLLIATHNLFFSLPFHLVYPTKNWRTLLNAFERVYKISMGYIKDKLDEIKEQDKKALENSEDQEAPVGVDFLTYMSQAGKMPLDKITSNAIDLMTAGIDTTSLTLLWTLYALATNLSVQDKLREEIQMAMGSDVVVTPSHIHQMPYLRDCIKEAQRLYPIAPNNTRILDEAVILSGYRIPAGTTILMPIVGAGSIPDNFPEPEKYLPERWSRDNNKTPNVFASLPFGFGTRMCVGRRVAELELHIALAKLIKTFRVEYRDEERMDYVQNLFLVPERRMDLAFIDL